VVSSPLWWLDSGDRSSAKGMHVLVKLRSLRKPLLTLLALLIAFAGVQFGSGAPSALAGQYGECPPGAVRKASYPEASYDIEERCSEILSYSGTTRMWLWEFSGVKPKRTDRRTVWVGGDNSPPYTMSLQALISDSHAGGAAAGRVVIAQPNGSNLDRRIAVLVRTQYYRPSTGWGTCRNGVWREASTQRSYMQWTLDQGAVPDCGNGSYRTQVYGRFFSVSLNSWVQRGPIYSPSISLPPGV
jgi:hypothetical protein